MPKNRSFAAVTAPAIAAWNTAAKVAYAANGGRRSGGA